MLIEVSVGEVVDKYTILLIKMSRCEDPIKLAHIQKECEYLREQISRLNIDTSDAEELLHVNTILWDIEDKIRLLEQEERFDEEFIETARAVYFNNDRRFEIKNMLNKKYNSEFSEQKILPTYKKK